MEATSIGVAIIPVLFMLFFFVIGILGTILWIWMLVECLTKESSEGNDKIVWLLVIFFLNSLGALVYFLVRRPKRMAELGR